MSGATAAAPVRWGVSQLTQDQALSVEEAPATGALEFEWADPIDLFRRKKTGEKAQPQGERKRTLRVPGPGPDAQDVDLDAAPVRRRRAVSAP